MAINYELNYKYFNDDQSLLKSGGICLLIGITIALIASIKYGSVCIIAGFALIYFWYKGLSTGEMLDQQCAEIVATIKDRAIEKLGIDEDQVSEAAPIFFDGYDFEPKWNALYKEEDSVWRSSNYQGAVFFFSEEQVYYYSYTFSLINKNYSDDTEEYFYKDIVAVSTKSEERQGIPYEVFILTTSGGTTITAAFSNATETQKAINGMRSLLRQKKSS